MIPTCLTSVRDTTELQNSSLELTCTHLPSVSHQLYQYYRSTNPFPPPPPDIWSSGCVLAELLIGQPIFAGESAIDQLVEIVKVLGTPTRDQILAMNPDYHEYKPFPLVQAHPWSHVLGDDTPEAAINLVDRMLIYVPHSRITALEVCAHPFFDELRTLHFQPETNLPPLFNFTAEELKYAEENGLTDKLVPKVFP
eukprot:TRINITY_DN13545_c0_g1_i13.p1 TRINITY_DN13545_c0_g1~~TRINITY_DN13545_c0_g1_i13.p1  ORF type:complete len:196 (-),score=29.07 TRINITY_DN13545_c0_g1_i13:58-645(-)